MKELYQELILDHGLKPRHHQEISDATHSMDGDNPLCGDNLTVYLKVKDGMVLDASFTGHGCAISMAAASMMLEVCIGQPLTAVNRLYALYHQQLMGDPISQEDSAVLGKLAAFSGVSEYPMRVKCATLCWHTMDAALKGVSDTVCTE